MCSYFRVSIVFEPWQVVVCTVGVKVLEVHLADVVVVATTRVHVAIRIRAVAAIVPPLFLLLLTLPLIFFIQLDYHS